MMPSHLPPYEAETVVALSPANHSKFKKIKEESSGTDGVLTALVLNSIVSCVEMLT